MTVQDLLLPDVLAPLLKDTIFGNNLHHYFKIGSTSTAAMEAASAGAPQGSVFLAEQQTSGRGRGANIWHSEQSCGIYCSVVLRPPLPPSDALILSLAAGLAVHSAVQQLAPGVISDLKWPNDLLLDGKKFCGVLTEMNAEATRVRYLVVGIGINVNQTQFPAALRDTATSLRMVTANKWSRVELCGALLKSLDREYRDLLKKPGAHDSILLRFQERSSSVRGQAIEVNEDGGYEGTTEGLDTRGFLRVRTEQGIRTVLGGTIRLKRYAGMARSGRD
jgi:BirA family transcriptional regulator, biotin operon repressor / biotin---[acetyl-CoA-carboxylase] ligase